MPRSLVALLLAAILWLGWSGSGQGQVAPVNAPYLAELVGNAREHRLARTREWEVLLHYHRTIVGGVVSEADGADFFLAPDGKRDPEAELDATLAAFFSPPVDDPLVLHPQCRFVARYAWLNTRLGFDPARLPTQDCARFREWMAALNPESATLIFPSAYLNNPSSMFGHTLLRIDRAGRADANRLLDYTINFAAATDNPTAFSSIVLGLTGGLPGRFSITPYYIKAKEYNDLQSRDIWEYRLAFSRAQIENMLRHAWELGNTHFDYYFFTQNCSYQLLALLDAADPALHLADRFPGWTIPTDTVRAILDVPGLVTRVSFRPALSTQLIHHRSLLNRPEDRWLFRVLRDPAVTDTAPFEALPDARRAAVIDVATEYLAYQKIDDPDHTDLYNAQQRRLLVERAALRVASDDSPPPAPPPPERGHSTTRIGVGGGRSAGEWFGQLAIRPALHDLLGDETGYTPNTHLEFMNAVVRYNRASRVSLHRLDVIRIISLTPYDRLISKLSWQISAGVVPVEDLSFHDRSAPTFELGVGGAAQSGWWRREVWYLLGETSAQYGAMFDNRYRAGFGATAGALVDVTSRWRAHVAAIHRGFLLGHRSSDLMIRLDQRYTIAKDWDARLQWSRRLNQTEIIFGVNRYF
ncbi:MAG: DUF4105 domain-containing protein [Nitrospirota bacterium]